MIERRERGVAPTFIRFRDFAARADAILTRHIIRRLSDDETHGYRNIPLIPSGSDTNPSDL